jgi:hypothetical protein
MPAEDNDEAETVQVDLVGRTATIHVPADRALPEAVRRALAAATTAHVEVTARSADTAPGKPALIEHVPLNQDDAPAKAVDVATDPAIEDEPDPATARLLARFAARRE